MNQRSISSRTYPADMVTHLQSLAAERPGDAALIVVHQAVMPRSIKRDYGTLDQHVRALAAT